MTDRESAAQQNREAMPEMDKVMAEFKELGTKCYWCEEGGVTMGKMRHADGWQKLRERGVI